MATGNTVKLGRGLAAKTGVTRIPQPTFRKGKVSNVTGSVVKVTIGDDPTPITVANSDSNYVPVEGDVVDLRVTDTETTIEGMLGDVTALARLIKQGVDPASGARAAITYGNLASPAAAGPSVTTRVGSSGIVVVVVTCKISSTGDNDGGAVGVALSGANTAAADDAKSLQFEGNVIGGLSRVSAVLYYAGLAVGNTTFTMQYKDLLDTGSDVDYALREILVVPL